MNGSSGWLRVSCLGAFLVPGVALSLPSGYSFGAALLLVAALAALPRWWGRRIPREAWWLIACFAGMAALWLLEAASAWHWSRLDRPSKYLLVVPCLLFLLAFPPRAAWLCMGIAAGGIGAGLTGLAQVLLHDLRARGYTNAIQYGNLSLLLGVMAAVALFVQWPSWRRWQRLLLGAGAALGVAGSVVSQTRGGWLALLLMLPACFWLLARARLVSRAPLWLAGCALAVALLSQTTAVQQRVQLAWQELQAYASHQDRANSVGYRIDLWRMAWELGLQRPLTGWGQAGYDTQQAARVAAGQLPPAVLELHHAHNELLDVFAKRGLPGVLLLLAFYAIPAGLFWPRAERIHDGAGRVDRESLALCLVGSLLPLSYVGFGLTQVFLAHNSGNMFYLFMCALVFAALHERRRQLA